MHHCTIDNICHHMTWYWYTYCWVIIDILFYSATMQPGLLYSTAIRTSSSMSGLTLPTTTRTQKLRWGLKAWSALWPAIVWMCVEVNDSWHRLLKSNLRPTQCAGYGADIPWTCDMFFGEARSICVGSVGMFQGNAPWRRQCMSLLHAFETCRASPERPDQV